MLSNRGVVYRSTVSTWNTGGSIAIRVFPDVDNTGAIALSGDPSHHARTKHIDVKYHILRDYCNTDQILVRWVPSKDNVADIFTKPLPGPLFVTLRGYLGLR